MITGNHICLRIGIAVADVQLARNGWRRCIDGENGARTGRIKCINIGLGPETSQIWLRLPEIVTVGQHGRSTLLCDTKKRCHLARTRAALCSWYHLVLTISPPNQFGANYPHVSANGLYPEHLTTTNCASGIRLPSHVQEAYPKEARTR